jgi:hypothetical protein
MHTHTISLTLCLAKSSVLVTSTIEMLASVCPNTAETAGLVAGEPLVYDAVSFFMNKEAELTCHRQRPLQKGSQIPAASLLSSAQGGRVQTDARGWNRSTSE